MPHNFQFGFRIGWFLSNSYTVFILPAEETSLLCKCLYEVRFCPKGSAKL